MPPVGADFRKTNEHFWAFCGRHFQELERVPMILPVGLYQGFFKSTLCFRFEFLRFALLRTSFQKENIVQ